VCEWIEIPLNYRPAVDDYHREIILTHFSKFDVNRTATPKTLPGTRYLERLLKSSGLGTVEVAQRGRR
jgi:hypothetical protein